MVTGRLTMRVKMMRTRRYTYVQQQKSRLTETQTHQIKCKHTHTHTHAHVITEGISSTDMDIIQCKKTDFFHYIFLAVRLP